MFKHFLFLILYLYSIFTWALLPTGDELEALSNLQDKDQSSEILRMWLGEQTDAEVKEWLTDSLTISGANRGHSKYGLRPLHVYAHSGDSELFELMMSYYKALGISVDTPDYYGRSSLSIAAGRGHETIVKYLLKNGADVNYTVNEEWPETALTQTCKHGHYDIARFLLKNGASINPECLIAASRYKKHNVVKLLLDNGADPNGGSPEYRSPLIWAIYEKNFETALLLVERGANVNTYEDMGTYVTPLGRAVERCFSSTHPDSNLKKLIENLLEHGADPNRYAPGTLPPLQQAIRAREFEIARLLVEHGADVVADAEGSGTALDHAVGRCFSSPSPDSHLKRFIEYLLEHAADPNVHSSSFLPPLRRALEAKDFEIARLLLERGANADTYHGCPGIGINGTPLDLALKHCSPSTGPDSPLKRLIECLLKHGDPNAKSFDGRSALNRAIVANDYEITRLLVEYGAKVTDTDTSITPLGLAAKQYFSPIDSGSNPKRIIEFLLEHGADPNANSSEERPPLYQAVFARDVEVASLLVKHGANVNASAGVLAHEKGAPLNLAAAQLISSKDPDSSQKSLIKLLLRHRADVDVVNSKYRTSKEFVKVHKEVVCESDNTSPELLVTGGIQNLQVK